MIDIHSHVLPMVDDGSDSWDETESLFRKMAAVGYTRVVATSHWAAGMPNVADEIVEGARTRAERFGLSLSIGRECRIHPNLLDHVNQNPQLRIDGGRVVLVELPWGTVPHYTAAVFKQLIQNGYRPVLAHAARHASLWEPNSPLDALFAMGVPIQVNLATISGEHGRNAQKRALALLEQGRVSLFASDIHSVKDFNDDVVRPIHILEGLIGPEATNTLIRHNPQALLELRPLVNFSDGSATYSINEAMYQRLTKREGVLGKLLSAFSISS